MIEIDAEVLAALLEKANTRGWMASGDAIEVYISSSAIRSVAYSLGNSELTVNFTDGSTYTYSSVPPDEVIGLLNANSKGQYFNAHIRDEYGY